MIVKEPSHSELVEAAAVWLRKTCSVVITEIATIGEEPDAIGWRGKWSTLVECKISRADFHADKKKYFRRDPAQGIGFNRYFLTAPNIVKLEEVPVNWGLLVLVRGKVRVLRKSENFHEMNCRHETEILLSTLRRLGCSAGDTGCSIKRYTLETKNRATVGMAPLINP